MSALSLYLRRSFFALMRSVAPVLPLGKQVWVFRDADVREILRRDQDFTLRPINATNIERRIGPFLLSLDDGPQYQHEVGVLRSMVHQGDVARIRKFVRQLTAELGAELAREGSFDLVSRFTRLVPLRLLETYFGIPGPDPETMLAWNRILFWDIFLNQKNDPSVMQKAEQAAEAFNAYLTELIDFTQSQLQSSATVADTLLSRMIRLQGSDAPSLDNDGIRRTLAGTLLGAEEPIAKACVNILNQFFQRPRILEQAVAAAEKDDLDTVSKLAFEAFRFHPNLPVIIRHAERELQIGPEGKRKRTIPQGKTVYAFIASAMFDRRQFPEPGRFRLDRKREDYLFFGHGLHTCYGNYINYLVIPEMIAALLRIPGLKPKGKIQFEGTFPDRWLWGC
jgi:cytochrome P450